MASLCKSRLNTERFWSGDLEIIVFYDEIENALSGNYCVTIENLCDSDHIHMLRKPFIFLIKWLAHFDRMNITANFNKEQPTHEISVKYIESDDKFNVSCNNKSIIVRGIYSHSLIRLEKLISERLAVLSGRT